MPPALLSIYYYFVIAVLLPALALQAGGSNDTAADEEAEEDQVTITLTTPWTQLPIIEESDYIVKVNDIICIRASFVVSFRVKYVSKKHPNRLLMNETLLTMPKKVKVSGTCTPELAVLTLSWEEDNFSLSFDLRPDDREASDTSRQRRDSSSDDVPKDDDVLRGWSTSEIRFSLNTNDADKFTHPLYPGQYTTKSVPSSHFFWTPRNQSFTCRHEQKVTLLEYVNGTVIEENVVKVIMYIASFQIQAFDIPQDGEFGPGASCQADIFDTLPKQNLVPIVVAVCLACLIIIIVIAYFISKNLGQNAYRAMD